MTLRAKPVSRGSRRSGWDSGDRRTFLLNLGFVVTITVSVLILIGYAAWSWYDDHYGAAATVDGTTITKDQLRSRYAIETFRIDYTESRIRTLQAAGRMSEATAASQIEFLEQRRNSLAADRRRAARRRHAPGPARRRGGPHRHGCRGRRRPPRRGDDRRGASRLGHRGPAGEQRRQRVSPGTPRRRPRRRRRMQALADLKSGTSWEDVAKTASSSTSAAQNGDLGWLPRGERLGRAVHDRDLRGCPGSADGGPRGGRRGLPDRPGHGDRARHRGRHLPGTGRGGGGQAGGLPRGRPFGPGPHEARRQGRGRPVRVVAPAPRRPDLPGRRHPDAGWRQGPPHPLLAQGRSVRCRYAPGHGSRLGRGRGRGEGHLRRARQGPRRSSTSWRGPEVRRGLGRDDRRQAALLRSHERDRHQVRRGDLQGGPEAGRPDPAVQELIRLACRPVHAPVRRRRGGLAGHHPPAGPRRRRASRSSPATRARGTRPPIGGDIGWVAVGQLGDLKEAPIFAASVGGISDVVAIDGEGVYLFKVLAEEQREATEEQIAIFESSGFDNWYAAKKAAADITRSGSAASATE